MNFFGRLVVVLLILCITVSYSKKNFADACETKKIITEIRHSLLAVENFKIVTISSIEDMVVETQLIGKIPDQLRIQLEIPYPTGLTTVLAIFDGTNQWVETKNSSITQVIKINLAELTTPERPFDTSYYIMGTGLLNGESYPETITTLLSVYDLKADCLGTVVVLSGPINIKKFKEYVAKRRSVGSQHNIEKFVKVFGYLNLEFDLHNLIIQKYSLGSAQGKASFIVQFKDVQTNQGVEDNDFTYSLPSGVVPVDITEDLKDQTAH